MKIKPMVGEFELSGIQRIGTMEDRVLVEVPVPGLEGSYHQDMGSGSASILIEGTLAGDDARDAFLASLRELFNAGDPVAFVADITTATEIDQVLLADLFVGEAAGSADTFRYAIVLTQYVEPPPAPSDMGFGNLSELNEDLAAEAGKLFDALQIPDLLGAIPEISDPTPPLAGALDGVRSTVEGLAAVAPALDDLFGEGGG